MDKNVSMKKTKGFMSAKISAAVLLSGLSVTLVGCATPLTVTSYGAKAQCTVASKPSAVLVNAPAGKTLAADKSFTISLKKDGKTEEPSRYFNLDEHWLVRVSLGEKPTAGYGVSLASEEMSVIEGVATVQLTWQAPEPEGMMAQVMTNPCVYLQIQKGDYSQIKFVDAEGKVHFMIDVPRVAEQ